MVAPALGPLLSGYLLEYADWRLIFLINLPVGVLASIVGLRALPSISAGRLAGRLDSLGIVLGPLAFASLSFGVSQSTAAGWTSPSTLAGIGIVLLASGYLMNQLEGQLGNMIGAVNQMTRVLRP